MLCNPPFEDFSAEKKTAYGANSTHKPFEILTRVLDVTRPDCLLGFVLPSQFLDGLGYRVVRNRIVNRYRDIEVVSLPGKLFNGSDHETSLLIAKPASRPSSSVSVLHRRVMDAGKETFLATHAPTYEDTETKSTDSATRNLAIIPLRMVWEFLKSYTKLGKVITGGRGVEWPEPFDEEKYVSVSPKAGFRNGLLRLRGPNASSILMFEPPARTVYLSFRQADRRVDKAFDLPWDERKIIMNAVRRTRKSWRITAFVDECGLTVSQNFHGLWPTSNWSARTICAVLNSYVAAAFVGAHSPRKHITQRTLAQIPLPRLSQPGIDSLDRLVEGYVEAIKPALFGGSEARAIEILNDIDAIILKGYGLPVSLERELLSYVIGQGDDRPVSVPFTLNKRDLQRSKNKSAIRLLRKWTDDESGYDEAVWPQVKRSLEEDRDSIRPPFDE